MKVLRVWVALFLVFAAVSCRETGVKSAARRIAVFKIVQHPAIDAMERGFREAMEHDGALGPVEIVSFNANGRDADIASYADLIAAGEYDLAFVLGTPCALKLKDRTSSLPIIVGGATDPVGTGLVASNAAPGGNITGTTDLPPFEKHLRYLRAIAPNARRVGVVFNQTEANSMLAVRKLEDAARAQGMTVRRIPVSTGSDVPTAVAAARPSIDVLCLPTDNTVQSNIEPIVTAAEALGLPTFNCDRDSVIKGVTFSVAVDYYDLGVLSARIGRDVILKKAVPASTPIAEIENPHIFVNERAFQRLHLPLVHPDGIPVEILR